MKAMLLAAGRGERMRPLTDTTPKPLLRAGGKALIVWHLERLRRAGFRQIIINHAWLGALVEATLAREAPETLDITYSPEGEPLETAGGIANALPLFASSDESFLVINSDIWCDFDPGRARTIAQQMSASNALAHLVMVPNPAQHPHGDFALMQGRVHDEAIAHPSRAAASQTGSHPAPRLTFSGIGIYRPSLFGGVVPGSKAKLAPLLRAAMRTGQVSGELHSGAWEDIGTPERLAALDTQLRTQPRALQ